jgi:NAD(P)-dependent dehydrogenase (short-subunit alcohol dehydrogenase family)
MQGLLSGKVAVITGAGSGLGRAATLLFCEQGARVIAADVVEANAAETAQMAVAAGGRAVAMACDVSDADQVKAVVSRAVEAFGRLDIMFNNAGIAPKAPPGLKRPTLAQTAHEEMQRVHEVNVDGVIFGCQAAVTQFLEQGGGGVIVNTASIAGLMGDGSTLYSATKGAVTALTRTLAMEVAKDGIRVNSVCPAGMLTNFATLNPNAPNADEVRAGMAKAYPLGLPVEPIDCANAALFLASDMSAKITGLNLPVDGGKTAGLLPS